MNTTSKDTIHFCMQFLVSNVDEMSQRTQARVWLKMAISTVEKENEGSKDFVIAELMAIDRYLSGADSKMTSVDVLTKIDTVNQLLGL